MIECVPARWEKQTGSEILHLFKFCSNVFKYMETYGGRVKMLPRKQQCHLYGRNGHN
ncbi:hypothetical protein EDD80_11534 [Anseongella ginsenosidimutans]|uniref:Uncharacterized protein n=1 Tax=Anseongella ginsenosidimutans TaxID=496056 RepID=A0A4R3KLN7_9SPHI|nr:hypothetical protein EDD80_11534 [Anseongella ginsenosidimutans]